MVAEFVDAEVPFIAGSALLCVKICFLKFVSFLAAIKFILTRLHQFSDGIGDVSIIRNWVVADRNFSILRHSYNVLRLVWVLNHKFEAEVDLMAGRLQCLWRGTTELCVGYLLLW